MSSVWGSKVKYSIFGESHGKAIGVNIDGLPAGCKLDMDYIRSEMDRRMPGLNKLSTPRQEKDEFEILSGYFNGYTTGSPICAVIYNSDQRSKDYEKTKYIMRPSHADYTGYIKYSGYNDYRGGGHFSGRLTAPLVFAGAIAKKILLEKDIIIGSHIYSIGDISDSAFDMADLNNETLAKLKEASFPVLDKDKGELMKKAILDAKSDLDSVGGVIEIGIINLPAGLGDPFFDSAESILSHILFSIPAVKGVEFGAGFDIAKMRGSASNDELYIKDGKVKSKTNNNGGILGGITNGMPLIVRAAFKPTPSISKVQNTVDMERHENTKIKIEGRHDPCIVPRACPVVEAAAAMAILELIL
jgi:chorismate synthase